MDVFQSPRKSEMTRAQATALGLFGVMVGIPEDDYIEAVLYLAGAEFIDD